MDFKLVFGEKDTFRRGIIIILCEVCGGAGGRRLKRSRQPPTTYYYFVKFRVKPALLVGIPDRIFSREVEINLKKFDNITMFSLLRDYIVSYSPNYINCSSRPLYGDFRIIVD